MAGVPVWPEIFIHYLPGWMHCHLDDVRRSQSLTRWSYSICCRAFGAALVPLSQSTMMDIYPVEQRGKAMAIWGVGVMVVLFWGLLSASLFDGDGQLAYVFYINLPFGILATLA
jgi:DHA2 family multidrug resistance protein